MTAPISSRSVPRLFCLTSGAQPGAPETRGFCPGCEMWLPLGRLNTCPRHTGHPQDMGMAGCTKMLRLYRTHITSEKHREHHVGTYTSVSRLTSTRTVTDSLSTAWPFCSFDVLPELQNFLSIPWAPDLPAGLAQGLLQNDIQTHILIAQAPHSPLSPWTLPAWCSCTSMGHLTAAESSLEFAVEWQMHTPCTPILRVTQMLAPAPKLAPGVWAASHSPASAATAGPQCLTHTRIPVGSAQTLPSSMWNRGWVHAKLVTTVCNKEIGWIVMISCRLHLTSVLMASFYMQPASFIPLSIGFPLHSSVLPLPLSIPSAACIASLTPPSIFIHPWVCKVLACLQLLDSPQTTVTGQVYFLSLSPLYLSVRFVPLHLLVSIFHLFLLSLFCIEKVLDHTSLKEKVLSPPMYTWNLFRGLAGTHVCSLQASTGKSSEYWVRV